MKKTMLFVAVCLLSLAASAQILEVVSMQKLPVPVKAEMKVAGVSPAGDYILLTSGTNQGLQRYDVATGKTITITTAPGAGYNVQISNDGQEIVYRETTVGKDHLRKHNIVRMNMVDAKRAVVAKAQRDASAMVTSSAKQSVSIQDRLMVVNRNGKNIVVAPNGKHLSYIWASISPDGTKLCYYVCGNGCWVSNIDGSNKQYIAHACRAAQWYDNNTIVAMADEDDGHFTTASRIVAYTLDGKKQVLTNDSMIAIEPYAAANAVVFSTLDGEVYMLNVK